MNRCKESRSQENNPNARKAEIRETIPKKKMWLQVISSPSPDIPWGALKPEPDNRDYPQEPHPSTTGEEHTSLGILAMGNPQKTGVDAADGAI